MQFSRASSPPPSIPYRPLDLSLRDRPPLLAYDSQKYFSDHDVRSASFQKRSNGHFWTYWSLRKRLLVAGLCVGGVAVLAAIIGLLVRKVGRSKDHSSGASNTNATSSKPSDPSSFTKDPRLHQTFWGFAYTPNASNLTKRAYD